MIVRFACYCVFLCLAVQLGVKAEVQVENHAYKNLLISFAPNVLNLNGQSLLNTLQELLQNTSRVLRTAIGIRIGTVTVRLPSSWDVSGLEGVVSTSEGAAEKPDILVDATKDSAFGKQPIALQHGGCGVTGHQITIPLDFLGGPEDFPKGKLLAREWLKYRYGVFDENGVENDSMYPDYYKVPGSSDIRITECTHPEVEFDFKQPNNVDVCSMDIPFEFNNCRMHPKEESAANVTSSLMFFHKDLPQMEHICGEEHPHKAGSPSKHNTLCNGKSIWEVLKSSSDFASTTAPGDDEGEPIQFSLIQEPRPRVAVVWENTENFFDKRQVIQFGIKRFLYDLPPQSKCGLYSFTNEPRQVVAFSELSAETKEALSLKNDFVVPVSSVCITCGLSMAVDALKQDNEKGTIILIADSNFAEDVGSLKEKLQGSDLCLSVIIYSSDNSTVQSYEVLNNAFSCISIHDINDEDKASSFGKMYDSMQHHLPKAAYDYEETTVGTGFMSSTSPLSIPTSPLGRLYTIWLDETLDSQYIECKAGKAQVTLERDLATTLISSYRFEAVDDDTITDISCKIVYEKLGTALAQVRMTTKPGHYFDFEVWTSDTTPASENQQMPVIIYARINFGRYPVKNADVTATVTRVSAEEELHVQLFDNGRGDPDITQYDGIYSGYFVDFADKGDYEVMVEAKDIEGQTMIGKEGSDVCCGSQVKSTNASVPPFQLQESTQFSAKSKKPDDGYRPSRIFDLRVQEFQPPNFIVLSWTAPGGGKASSYEFYLFCESEDCNKDGRLPHWLRFNQTHPKPKPHDELEDAEFLFTPELPRDLTVFFTIKTVAGIGQLSDFSNRVEVVMSSVVEPNTTAKPIRPTDENKLQKSDIGTIVGVCIIVFFSLLCFGAVIYFFLYQRGRKAMPVENGATQTVSVLRVDGTEMSGSFRAGNSGDREPSMRRVESFPVLLYTHDQIKDFKKKTDPPLYKPAVVPKPWMSMNVLLHDQGNKDGETRSLSSASTLPASDRYKSTEIKQQMEDFSQTSEEPHQGKSSKF